MARANKNAPRSPAAEVAIVAVMVALLIAAQFAFSFVAGVEVVTVLLLCFCWSYGARTGVLAAVSFSLLRCIFFGFSPATIILYLIYYPSFAAAFGSLGSSWRSKKGLGVAAVIAINVVLASLALASAWFAASGIIKLPRPAKLTISVLMWVICGLCGALIAVTDIVHFLLARRVSISYKIGTAIFCASLAAVFTVVFTLLDDVITPLVLGWGFTSAAALSYFYSSFLAMAPQVVCVIVTVSALFIPLTRAMSKFAND